MQILCQYHQILYMKNKVNANSNLAVLLQFKSTKSKFWKITLLKVKHLTLL